MYSSPSYIPYTVIELVGNTSYTVVVGSTIQVVVTANGVSSFIIDSVNFTVTSTLATYNYGTTSIPVMEGNFFILSLQGHCLYCCDYVVLCWEFSLFQLKWNVF